VERKTNPEVRVTTSETTRALRVERAFVDETLQDEVFAHAGSLAAQIERIEADAMSPANGLAQIVRALGEAGLLGWVVPARNGGKRPEVSSVALCLARERLAYISPLADLAFAMQGLGSHPLVLGGAEPLQHAWLPHVAAGDVITAFALTEPEAGTDLGGITLTAHRAGDHYRLDGEKVFISNAGVAHLYTVFAATRPPGEPKRLTAFAVVADTPGLTIEPMDVLGGHPIGRLRFKDAEVHVESRIGAEGAGMGLALGTLHRFRTTVGAAAVGFAARALDEAVSHVTTRRQFGAPLSELQAVQLRIADMACELEAARLLVYRAAALADSGAERSAVAYAASMAKLVATESAQRVVDHAVQLHGGHGVERGSIVARLYEEVRSLRIYEGTSDVQRLLIAREVLTPSVLTPAEPTDRA
jgi:acyl-CoA dehydrogenase